MDVEGDSPFRGAGEAFVARKATASISVFLAQEFPDRLKNLIDAKGVEE